MTDRLFYQVIDGPLSVRSTPGTAGARVGELPNGMILEVDAMSRSSVDGFVWWKHNTGWSAEGSADGKTVFMTQVTQAAPTSGEEPTFYQVINGPVSIRANPDATSTKLGELPNGTVIEVLADGRASGGGFSWVKHERGWSALGKIDGTSVFMQPANITPVETTTPTTPPSPTAPAPSVPEPVTLPAEKTPEPVTTIRFFQVTDGPVTIRKLPDPASEKVGELANGSYIEVKPDSRTINAGFIYWQHQKGWSAERRVGSDEPFMTVVSELPAPEPVIDQTVTTDGTLIQFFEVVEGPISIRSEPSLSATRLGQYSTGEQFEVVPRSRTENQGYVWWQHSKGWSPERKIGSDSAYVTVIPKITRKVVDGVPYLPLIVQHPVALADTQWIQYYGNTIFAHKLRLEGKFWYNYCQSLHGGFDYGTSKPVPIVAGAEGTIIDVNINKATYSPNYTRVKVGPYIFIYGHIARPSMFNVGDKVGPDTLIGFIDAGGQNHLHFEVRFGLKVINPLEVMIEERRNEITNRFKDYAKHFYTSATWNLWQNPYDQPVLNLQNKGSEVIIGPHAR